jgi:SAM-dependent methyltransferase
MIRIAQERSQAYDNIDYQVADVLTWECEPKAFDCIASIATLHHLPIEETLMKLKHALRPNGTLLILDLYRGKGPADRRSSLVLFPLSVVLKAAHNRRPGASREERDAWAVHGRHDRYPTVSEVRRVCASTLPGATVRRHLFWRYSIVWRKECG